MDFSFQIFNQFQRLRNLKECENPSMIGRINSFNLNIVEEKVQAEMYKSTIEFIKDIRIIRHNAEIVLPGKHLKH